jgi:AraC-like DNA-binding protein
LSSSAFSASYPFFRTANGEYLLSAGSFFAQFPGVFSAHYASKKKPWTYAWILCKNKIAAEILHKAGITPEHPVLQGSFDRSIAGYFDGMLTVLTQREAGAEDTAIGYAHLIIGRILKRLKTRLQAADPHPPTVTGNRYVNRAHRYIRENFGKPIRIREIAEHAGLERTYFTRLFRAHCGISPQEYLIRYRIEQAKLLLAATSLSAKGVERAVGYAEYRSFLKAFTARAGKSPEQYRRDNP